MAGNLNENLDLLQKLFDKQVITKAEYSYILLTQAFSTTCIINLLIEEEILNNDQLILFFADIYNLPLLKGLNINIKIDENLDFIKQGFFIYQINEKLDIVINNLQLLNKIEAPQNLGTIYLIKHKEFTHFMAQALAGPITYVSLNNYENIDYAVSAKNIDYKNL